MSSLLKDCLRPCDIRTQKLTNATVATMSYVHATGVNQVATTIEWYEVEVTVDSGAEDSVSGPNTCVNCVTQRSYAQANGIQFETASGDIIEHVGQEVLEVFSQEGVMMNMTVQLAAVNKMLLSVGKISTANDRVVFDDAGSYIEDKGTGEKMYLEKHNNTYILKL